MNYCQYTDLVERFGASELDQLTEHAGDCPAIQSAIWDASAMVDVFLANRYSTPLINPVPFIIRHCVCDMVRYALWDTQATEHVRTRYEDALGLLKQFADGSISLDTAVNVATTSSVMVNFCSEPPKWSRSCSGYNSYDGAW